MIYKKLKTIEFFFDEESKELTLINKEVIMDLDKVRMFSLARFILRCSQKMSSHRRKHDLHKQ